MNYWLVKTEPEEYSFDALMHDGEGVWDGVRNFQARNNLKSMKLGDIVLVYHTGKNKEIVGIAKVSKESYPDPKDNSWIVVNIQPMKKLDIPYTLKMIKENKKLQNLPLIKQSRLSVMKISKDEYEILINKN